MSEFKNRLNAMQESWATGKNAPTGVPDGQYNLQLESAELKESQTSQKLMIHRKHVVLDGEHTGTTIHDYIVIEGEYGPRNLAEFIQQMGYEVPEQLEEVEGILSAIVNDAPTYTAQVKKAKDSDMRNVRIKSLLNSDGATAGMTAAEKKGPMPGSPAAKAKAAAPTPQPVKKAAPAKPAEPEQESLEGKTVIVEDVEYKVKEDKGEALVIESDDEQLYEVERSQVTVKEEEATEEAAPEASPEEEETRVGLIAFCQSHDIEVAEDEAIDSLKEKVNQFQWKKSELAPEEVTLLESVEATFEAEAAKPAPKAPAKAPPAKPATKPAPAGKAVTKPAAKTPPKPPAKKPAPTPAKKKK